ncbi:MAG: VOC family protein [Myxococcota bacterium]|nr:VOC family protein [Myxococcota bacterium]
MSARAIARPEGHQGIIPMLAYADAPAAIDFLCKAFGFEKTYQLDMDDGSVGHAELAMGDAVVMLATVWEAAGMKSPKDLPGPHSQVNVYVDDVDAHCEKAREAGATISAEPEDQFYGARIYRAVDPEGHRWIFTQHKGES